MIELAIVMGVAGLVMGGVWVMAAQVRTAVNQEQAMEQLASFATELRLNYQARSGLEPGITMHDLIQRSVTPQEMIRVRGAATMLADHALTGWGINNYVLPATGTFLIGLSQVDGTIGVAANFDSQMFRVEMRGLSVESCVYLMTNLTGNKGPKGLRRIQYAGGAGNTDVFPVSPSQALINCGAAPAWIGLSYPLRLH